MKKSDLTILILTFDLTQEIRPARYLPKVCHKIFDKTMIEIAIDTCLRLNPTKIILYVSKNNIECINKTLKHMDYSKMLSYCILDNDLNGKRRLSIGAHCFNGKNILVVPGNSPLLTTKTLFRMISENRDVKIHDSLFYLKKENSDKLDRINEMPITKDFLIPEIETKRVELKGDLDFVVQIVEERNKKLGIK
jgi:bifunctional N-acetylglucosamine-1-phosphate-uridyltransferase/glucosamine-1-phosphate-acetyltransferase GlmU-like protein